MVKNNLTFPLFRLFISCAVILLSLVDVSYGMKRIMEELEEQESKRRKIEAPLGFPLHQAMLAEDDDDCGVTCAAISPDGEFLALGDAGGLVSVFYTSNGTLVKKLAPILDDSITLLKWSSNSKSLRAYGIEDDSRGLPELVTWERKENNDFALLHQNGLVDTDAGKVFKELSLLSDDKVKCDKLFHSWDCRYIIGMADQKGNSLIRSFTRPYTPARVLVWGSAGKQLAQVVFCDAEAIGNILILDAQMHGSILTVALCDEQNVWMVSCNVMNTIKSVGKRELTGKLAMSGMACKNLELTLDENKQIRVRKLD